MSKSKIILVISALFTLMLIANVYAITGSIQGARMIITAETGESVERSIVVRNVNDVNVDINLTVTGDLADNVDLNEDEFTLEPDEEKRVYFTIEADEFGETETRINVKFTPAEGNGVILSAVIIFVASGENVDSGNSNSDNTDDTDDNSTGNSLSFGLNGDAPADERDKGLNLSPIVLLSISTGVLVIILILLMIYASKKKPKVDNIQKTSKSDLKKWSRRPRE